MLKKDIKEKTLLSCSISGGSKREEKTDFGLVKGHAFGITDVKKVPIGGNIITNSLGYISNIYGFKTSFVNVIVTGMTMRSGY